MELMKRAMALKDRIREAREGMGLTQNALARKAGVNHPTLHKIEAGQRTDVSAIILLKIARALNTTIEALLGEDVPLEPTQPSGVAALVEAVSRLEETVVQNQREMLEIAERQKAAAGEVQERLLALEQRAAEKSARRQKSG